MFSTLAIYPDFEYDFQKNLLDWYEVPLVLILIFVINLWVNKKNKENFQPNFKFFVNAKIAGAIFITLLFNLYYAGGDTTAYFNDGRILNKIMIDHPDVGLKMLLLSGSPESWSTGEFDKYTEGLRFYYPENTWLLCKISAVLQLVTFRSMLCTAMLFGFFSARVIWKFYTLLCDIYPLAKNYFKWGILFIPSSIMWGSGIFKDTVSYASLSMIFVCVYYMVNGGAKSPIKNFIYLLLSCYLLFTVKSYILFSFLASMAIWIPFAIRRKIGNGFFRAIFGPLIFGSILTVGLLLYGALTSYLQNFAVEEILKTASKSGEYLKYVAELQDGSVYDIGTMDPTISGLLAKMPAAVNVTLFRPYIWESGKPIILVAALESTFILLWSLYIIILLNPFKSIYRIIKDPLLLTFFCFTVLFATFVGVSSFNFGTLVRYKIPCIPFYLIILSVLNSEIKKKAQLKDGSSQFL